MSSENTTKKRKEFEDPENSSIAKRSKTSTDTQAPINISNLPDEALEKIFEFAVGSKCTGFLNLSLACRQWNNLISTSMRIMNYLKPQIKLQPSKNVEKAVSFPITRKYREVTLELPGKHQIFNANPFLVVTSISSTLAVNLMSLTLTSLTLNPYFIGALISLENLQNLAFVRCDAEYVEVDKVQFKRLRNLKLTSTPGTILDWLKCEKLKSFSFEFQIVDSYLIGFLNQLKHLEELMIKEWKGWENPRLALKLEFKWNKFEFSVPGYVNEGHIISSWCLRLSNNAIANILALCQASSQNAEAHISIDSFCFKRSEADEMVNFLNSCKAIKTLAIRGSGAIKTNLSKLRSMDEVKTLIMPQDDGYEKLIEKLPNVKHLMLTDSRDKYNFQALPQLKMLEHLDVSRLLRPFPRLVESTGSDLLKFENLQSIMVPLKLDYYTEEKCSYPLRYELTESLWRFCSYNSSVKHVQFYVLGPLWRKTYSDGKLTDNSLISVYNSWSNYTTSVESCKFIIYRSYDNVSKGLRKTRAEKEMEVFGRTLNEKEKQFFSEIIIDGWND